MAGLEVFAVVGLLVAGPALAYLAGLYGGRLLVRRVHCDPSAGAWWRPAVLGVALAVVGVAVVWTAAGLLRGGGTAEEVTRFYLGAFAALLAALALAAAAAGAVGLRSTHRRGDALAAGLATLAFALLAWPLIDAGNGCFIGTNLVVASDLCS